MFDIPPLWLDDSLLEFIIRLTLAIVILYAIKLIFKWIYKKRK